MLLQRRAWRSRERFRENRRSLSCFSPSTTKRCNRWLVLRYSSTKTGEALAWLFAGLRVSARQLGSGMLSADLILVFRLGRLPTQYSTVWFEHDRSCSTVYMECSDCRSASAVWWNSGENFYSHLRMLWIKKNEKQPRIVRFALHSALVYCICRIGLVHFASKFLKEAHLQKK